MPHGGGSGATLDIGLWSKPQSMQQRIKNIASSISAQFGSKQCGNVAKQTQRDKSMWVNNLRTSLNQWAW